MAQTAKSCSQYSHKQQIITQIRTKYTAALAHETNSTSTTKDSPLIVRIPNWIAPSERRRTNGTNQGATNRCVTNHNLRRIESNRGGRAGSARYLLAALDVLDGDELTSPAVAHEAGDAEVAGADVAHELVPVTVVHDWHVHARPHRQRRPIRRRRCHGLRRRSTAARVCRVP